MVLKRYTDRLLYDVPMSLGKIPENDRGDNRLYWKLEQKIPRPGRSGGAQIVQVFLHVVYQLAKTSLLDPQTHALYLKVKEVPVPAEGGLELRHELHAEGVCRNQMFCRLNGIVMASMGLPRIERPIIVFGQAETSPVEWHVGQVGQPA
jgi:hypothetical protein